MISSRRPWRRNSGSGKRPIPNMVKNGGLATIGIDYYELGKIAVPASALIRIADFYHVSLDYLVGRDAGPAKAEPVRPGLYRHFKGKEYRVLYNAAHSETLEPLVVYQALYGERGVWVRPASMWSEHVERDGYSGPRFTYLGQ